MLLVLTHNHSTIKLPDRIVKYNFKHSQGHPSFRTTFPFAASFEIVQTSLSSTTVECYQHTLRNGHGVAWNCVVAVGNDDLGPSRPGRIEYIKPVQRSNSISPMFGNTSHSSLFRSHWSIQKTSYPAARHGFRWSQKSGEKGSSRLSSCMVFIVR